MLRMDLNKRTTDAPPPAPGSAARPVPSPGYYPDPEGSGGSRWWDGSQWTAHTTAPGPPPPVAPSGQGGPLLTATTDDARMWASLAHVSPLVFGWFGALAFVGPLLVLAIKGSSNPFIKQEATEALNFQLSALLYLIVGGTITVILIFVLVGLLLIPVLIAGAIAWLVFTIIATARASRGEAYRYPLTIRFIKG